MIDVLSLDSISASHNCNCNKVNFLGYNCNCIHHLSSKDLYFHFIIGIVMTDSIVGIVDSWPQVSIMFR